MCTFKQFSLCSNLLSKLKKNCFKVHKLILQIAKNCSKSNFFGQQHMINLNIARFACKHLWVSEHYISAYSKPVWTPCRNLIFSTTECVFTLVSVFPQIWGSRGHERRWKKSGWSFILSWHSTIPLKGTLGQKSTFYPKINLFKITFWQISYFTRNPQF